MKLRNNNTPDDQPPRFPGSGGARQQRPPDVCRAVANAANDNFRVADRGLTVDEDDCRAALAQMAKSSVDLFVTSPPYCNIGMEYDDRFDAVEDWVEFNRSWLKLAAEALTDSGSIWINVGHLKPTKFSRIPLTYYLFPIIGQCGLTMIQEVIWDRRVHLSTLSRFSTRSERWLWLVKKPQACHFDLDKVRIPHRQTKDKRNHPLGASPSDIWEFCCVQGRSKERIKGHPCQFPVAMIERIVLACSKPGDTVCDPFAGTGTTGKAALKHGRRAILIEGDAGYCDIIRNRLGVADLKKAA